jgi:hypothetical protein
MQLDLSQDWRAWDNLESATLQSRRNSGDMIDTILQAKRHKISTRELAASSGALQGGDVRFLLPAVLVLNGPPKPGDWILDLSENRFIVLAAEGRRRDRNGPTTWACDCRNIAIAFDLADQGVIIEDAVMTLDPSGVEVRTWKTLYSAFKTKVQLLEQMTVEERAIRGFEGTYAVYLEQELAVTNKMRVKWLGALAGYLEIVKYHPASVLGTAPVIDCKACP